MFSSMTPLPDASIIGLRWSLVKFSSVIFPAMRVTDRIVLEISGLVRGVKYAISVLPGPLRFLARLIPVTYSLEGMRAALLGGAGWRELWPSIAALLLIGT
jgi:ABC-type polysaccharide/polyol phosphate export permease